MLDFIRSLAAVVLILMTVVIQVLLRRYFPDASYLVDLPLIALLHITLAKESLAWTVFLGATVGLLRDSQSLSPLGMNGFTLISVASLVYLSNAIIAVDRLVTRFAMLFICSILADLLFWILELFFLNRYAALSTDKLALEGAVNACVGIPLFYFFDKIVVSSNE